MKIGIGLPNTIEGLDGRTIMEWARRAEARGFSSLATIGRVAFPTFDELVALSAAAAVTERIGLLTNVLVMPTRQPVVLAKEAATLASISGGRLTLGIGPGGRPDDYDASGMGFEDRGSRMDEALALMQRAWRGEPVAGSPEPVGPLPPGERVPLLIGGASGVSIRRAVQFGDGWTAGGSPPDQVGPFAERVREAWREAGREGEPRIVALAYFALGDDAEEQAKRNLGHYYAFTGEETAGMIAQWASKTADAAAQTRDAFEKIGVDEFIFDPAAGNIEQVDLLADAVL